MDEQKDRRPVRFGDGTIRVAALAAAPYLALVSHGKALWRESVTHLEFPISILWLNIIILSFFLLLSWFIQRLVGGNRLDHAGRVSVAYGIYLLFAPTVLQNNWPIGWIMVCDLLIIAISYCLVAGLYRKHKHIPVFMLLILFVYDFGDTIYLQLQQHPASHKREINALHINSSHNIYHILLDSVQGESIPHFLEHSARIREALKGFVYFPKFATNSIWTTDSVAMLLSGELIPDRRTNEELLPWRRRAFDKGLWHKLKAGGFRIELYPNYRHHCVDFADYCFSSMERMRKGFWLGWASLYYDLLVLRVVPRTLTKVMEQVPTRFVPMAIQNQGMKIFSLTMLLFPDYLTSEENRNALKVSAVRNFRLAIRREKELHNEGRYTFIHSIIPHRDYQLDEKCTYNLMPGKSYFERYLRQTECALCLCSELIEELQRLGRFRDSLIIIHSDHGHFRYPDDNTSFLDAYRREKISDPKAATIVQATSGLLLVKFPGTGREAEMTEYEALTQMVDITTTISKAANLDWLIEDGYDLRNISEDIHREINLFYRYGEKPSRYIRRGNQFESQKTISD
ncbi:hypothetical protein ACFL9T_17000 [Thermodesulfobacteriota bacterium]